MLKQNLLQKGQQKLSPKQIELIKLIELPAIVLEERIYNEILENPLLEYTNDNISSDDNSDQDDNIHEINFQDIHEEDNKIIDTSSINIDEYLSDDEVPSYRMNHSFNKNDNNYAYNNITSTISFYEYLKSQIRLFNLINKDILILNFIIDNLDDDGYLRIDSLNLINDIKSYLNIDIDYDYLNFLLINYIQSLHPYGIGARNLQECLMIQLRHKSDVDSKAAYHIIKYYFNFFYKKHYSKLIQKLNITVNDFKRILNIILRLNPKPGKLYLNTSNTIQYIIPDFYIDIVNSDLILSLDEKNRPNINISQNYLKIAYLYNNYFIKHNKETFLFIKKKLEDAKYFITAIKRRAQTLKLTMEAIMHYQREYFITGNPIKLKPMILKDIANILSLDISTVSRVANSKYVSTPYGVFLLKNFFSEGIFTDNGIKDSTLKIKNILLDVISKEDKQHPLNDNDIMRILNQKGYSIARRTITKYRHDLHIPVSRLRACII